MIHSFEFCQKNVGEIGTVTAVKDFIVKIAGLSGATIGEGITFANEEHGRVMAVEGDSVVALVLGTVPIEPGTKAGRTGNPISISAGEGLLGHIIDTVGHSLSDRRHKSADPEKRPLEVSPAGIAKRARISRFFETGVVVTDLLIPLGAGQRELVIGDRQSGKSHFLRQVMLSQAQSGKVGIYCAIGKRKTEIKAIEEFLEKYKIFKNCILVAADSNSSPGEIYIAPYTAMTLAEYFCDRGRDVFLILDDMTTHAKYYREISLLLERFPGRESYPGDIFHVHSKLLERAGNFQLSVNGTGKQKTDNRTVSITCLPVAESVGGDLTGYIQTNLMSMTDGHLYFDSELFFQGRRPPINIFLSVTRVGRQTQSPLLRDLGFQILRFLKNYSDMQRFMRFEMELSPEIQLTLHRGSRLTEFFNQVGNRIIPVAVQVYIVALIWLERFPDGNYETILSNYCEKPAFKKQLEGLMKKAKTFEELLDEVRKIK